MNYVILFTCIFVAGIIDSMAGGGGLITLPAYLSFGLPTHLAMGTNKFSACIGALVSSVQYVKNKSFVMTVALPSMITAVIFAHFGAEAALVMDEKILKYCMLAAIPTIAVFILYKKDFGKSTEKHIKKNKAIAISLFIGGIMGFYDGFFGPGTGTFLIILYTSILGMEITMCCGTARVVNLASNISSLAIFLMQGKVVIGLGIAAAIFSIAGSLVGTHLAIKKGVTIVKPAILVIIAILMVRIITDMI